jgi:hypothetical protein
MKQESTARNAVNPSAKSGVLRNLLSRRNSHSLARESGLTVCSMMFFAIVLCYLLASLFSRTGPLIRACCRVEESDDRIDAGAAWQRYSHRDCHQRVLGYCNRQGRLASL